LARTEQERWDTALHEAAHAVAYLVGGIGVLRVTIRGWGNQHMQINGKVVRARVCPEQAPEYIVALLAGSLGPMLGGLELDHPDADGGWSDRDKAYDIITWTNLGMSQQDRVNLMFTYYHQAAELLAKHRAWVLRVALALMANTTLSGKDVVALRPADI